MTYLTSEQEARLAAVAEGQVEKARNQYAEMTIALHGSYTDGVEDAAARIWELVKPTARSGNRAVRPSKPKGDGRAAYVWRMLRFHTGEDVHMPVTADWDLYNEVDRETGGHMEYDVSDEERSVRRVRYEQEVKRMDAVTDYILATKFPLRQFRWALAWNGLLY